MTQSESSSKLILDSSTTIGDGVQPSEEQVKADGELTLLEEPEVVPPEVPENPPKRKCCPCCRSRCCKKKPKPEPPPNGLEGEEERETWGNKVSYILSLVGYAVGFGNIWRFPYLLHDNGGIAFLIPYTVMLVVAGIPVFFLELAIGQRLKKGALGSWNEISPYLGGLGITCGVVCYFCALYYNTLLAWVISYVVDSFRSDLAWRSCEYQYNLTKGSLSRKQITQSPFFHNISKECYLAKQPSKYYWYRRTLDVSDNISDPGNFNPYMFLYLTVAWLIVAAILIKGIKSSEKVVYFTALFPYVTLLIFFIANFFQEGWDNGYTILLKPDFSKLLSPTTWLIAGTQIFFSLGVAFGVLVVFASYLPPKNDCYKDAVSVSIINCATSLFASLVIFPVLGAQGTRAYNECVLLRKFEFLTMEHVLFTEDYKQGESSLTKYVNDHFHIPAIGGVGSIINDNQINNGSIYLYYSREKTSAPWYEVHVSEGHHPNTSCSLEKEIREGGSGTGLVFIAFAEAAKNLPAPQFFCFLFFTMLFTLGVDSSFATVEGAMAAIIDLKIVKWPRWVITVITCSSLWLMAIVFSFGWGMYVQVFLDQFVANWSLLLIAIIETVGISYVYGLAKFAYDIKLMTGRKPNLYMMVCWKFVTPVVLVVILIGSVIKDSLDGYKFARYNSSVGDTKKEALPWWLLFIGFLILLAIVIWVPLQAILWRFKKSLLKRETPNFFPEDELRQERNLVEDDDVGDFNNLDKMVMGTSLQNLHEERRSANEIASSEANVKDKEDSVSLSSPSKIINS